MLFYDTRGPLVLYRSPDCWGYVKISGYWGKDVETEPLGRGRQPIRAKILMSTGRPHHYGHLLQVYKESLQPLTLYTSSHDLINVYSRRSGADNPRGQNFDVNRNLLSLQSFATSFKKISLKSDFIQFFFIILYMYIHVAPGQGLTTPRGRNFYVNRNILSLWSFVASCKKNLFEVWFYAIFFHDFIHVYSPGTGSPQGTKF